MQGAGGADDRVTSRKFTVCQIKKLSCFIALCLIWFAGSMVQQMLSKSGSGEELINIHCGDSSSLTYRREHVEHTKKKIILIFFSVVFLCISLMLYVV